MPTRVDEPIAVTLSPEGGTACVAWRRFEYKIFGVPHTFFRRRSWWREAEAPARIDHELWRVEASWTDMLEDVRTYDIARQGTSGGWRLSVAWK